MWRGTPSLAKICFGFSGRLGRPKCPRRPLVLAPSERKSPLEGVGEASYGSRVCADAGGPECESTAAGTAAPEIGRRTDMNRIRDQGQVFDSHPFQGGLTTAQIRNRKQVATIIQGN